jgi:hypothetical protein
VAIIFFATLAAILAFITFLYVSMKRNDRKVMANMANHVCNPGCTREINSKGQTVFEEHHSQSRLGVALPK